MILKQKKMFNKPIDEKRNEILELSEKIIYGELTYYFKDRNIPENFF